jgi:hypothetical protein
MVYCMRRATVLIRLPLASKHPSKHKRSVVVLVMMMMMTKIHAQVVHVPAAGCLLSGRHGEGQLGA